MSRIVGVLLALLVFASGAFAQTGPPTSILQGGNTAAVTASNELKVNCSSGCAGSTVTDTDDGSVAGGQIVGLGIAFSHVWDGAVWRRVTIGTAGTASAQVFTVQGIAAMTPLDVTCSSGCAGGTNDTDDGTIASGQTTGLNLGLTQIFDGTDWKRFTVGVAGTASAQVVTVQGVASMTPILVNGSAVTQPVSGSVTVTQATGTNLHVVTDTNSTTIATQSTAANLKTQAEAYQGGLAVSVGNPLQVTLANTGTNATAVKVDGSAVTQPISGTVTATGTITATVAPLVGAASATLASVASSASSVTCLASNGGRKMATVFNDSTATLYLKFGATATTASFTYYATPSGTFEMPVPVYTGIIDCIWASANGSARVTEW